MLGSVHIVHGGVRTTIASLRRPPIPAETPGLRDARCVVADPFGGRLPSPQPTRVGLVAFWDDEAALDAFLLDHPFAGTRPAFSGLPVPSLRRHRQPVGAESAAGVRCGQAQRCTSDVAAVAGSVLE